MALSFDSSSSPIVTWLNRLADRSPWLSDRRDALLQAIDRLRADDAHRRTLVKRTLITTASILIVGGASWWLVFGPMFKPDFAEDDLDDIFNYTLLTDQFNNLPVEERMKMIGTLVQRLRSMESGDAAMMAAFAAGVAGAAREQIERNASQLAVDVWDKFAAEYEQVPEAQKGEAIDRIFVEFTKTMEGIGGRVRNVSDEQRLEEARRQAQRDQQRLTDPNRRPGTDDAGRWAEFMQGRFATRADPFQRARGQLLARDMVRRLRGTDGGPR